METQEKVKKWDRSLGTSKREQGMRTNPCYNKTKSWVHKVSRHSAEDAHLQEALERKRLGEPQ